MCETDTKGGFWFSFLFCIAFSHFYTSGLLYNLVLANIVSWLDALPVSNPLYLPEIGTGAGLGWLTYPVTSLAFDFHIQIIFFFLG